MESGECFYFESSGTCRLVSTLCYNSYLHPSSVKIGKTKTKTGFPVLLSLYFLIITVSFHSRLHSTLREVKPRAENGIFIPKLTFTVTFQGSNFSRTAQRRRRFGLRRHYKLSSAFILHVFILLKVLSVSSNRTSFDAAGVQVGSAPTVTYFVPHIQQLYHCHRIRRPSEGHHGSQRS